ncbi:MAG: NYN domain protein [Promethearchaeota archaeon]|nr:MAG: NYN domain protein [Candidatus Lokiarchaeota archaeon]
MIFIDNSNIFKGFKKYNIKADYEKLKFIIAQERVLEGIFLYEGIVYPISNKKKRWYNDLSKLSGYTIQTSFDKTVSHDVFEKKIDVRIAIDMVSFAYEDKYDVAALVSGDGDFLPVIKKLNELQKKVEVWAFEYSLAYVLKDIIEPENLFHLDNYLEEIKI